MISRSFVYGARRAIEDSVQEALKGFILAIKVEVLLVVLRTAPGLVNVPADVLGFIGAYIAFLAVVAEFVSALDLFERMRFWSTGYLFGYLVIGVAKSALGVPLDSINGLVLVFGFLVLIFRLFRMLDFLD